MEVLRTSDEYRLRLRFPVHLGYLEGVPQTIRHSTPDVNSLPPADRWANGASESDNRDVSQGLHQSRAGQLGVATPDGPRLCTTIRSRPATGCPRFMPITDFIPWLPTQPLWDPSIQLANSTCTGCVRYTRNPPSNLRRRRNKYAIMRNGSGQNPGISSRGFGPAESGQYQNAPTVSEVGPQKPRPLPGGIIHRAPRRSPHAPTKIENPRRCPRIAMRTLLD